MELEPDEILRFRFRALRVRGRIGGAGDGEGGNGGEPRSSSSASDNISCGFLGTFDFDIGLTVFAESPDPADRVDLVDLGLVTDSRTDFGFESGFGVTGDFGLDLGEITRLVGEDAPFPSLEGSTCVSKLFPFGLGFGLVLILGKGSDLAGDSEGDLTFGIPLATGVLSTPEEVGTPKNVPPPPPSGLGSNLALALCELLGSGGFPFEDRVIGLPFFGEVALPRSGRVEVGSESTAEVGMTQARAGGLVPIRTYGICLLGVRVATVFFAVLGSEGGNFWFLVTLAGDTGRSSSVSSSLRERSMIKAEFGLLAKTDGARGRGGGNSKSISSRASSIVLLEVEATGCRLGVGEPDSSPERSSRLESSGVCERSGEEGSEKEDEGPGDDEGGGGGGTEARISGLGVLRTRCPR